MFGRIARAVIRDATAPLRLLSFLMMNKRTKTSKLQLHPETVRTLDSEQLSLVAAGGGKPSANISQCERCIQQ